MTDDSRVVHITGLFSDNPLWWRYLPTGELVAGPVERVDPETTASEETTR